jgi:MYXO-CTERM domain-containing protein
MRLPIQWVLAASFVVPAAAAADPIAPLRSWYELVSSNGYTGVVANIERGEIHHFREHLYATEEPLWSSDGSESWASTGGTCSKPEVVWSRDLLDDAYFGVRIEGSTAGGWLRNIAVDRDRSGYLAADGEGSGGTGIMVLDQSVPDSALRARTHVFAPWDYPGAAFVMALELRNESDATVAGVRAYALVNANLGSTRPGPRSEISAEFETITRLPDASLLEQGSAGLIYMRPLPAPARATHSPISFYTPVDSGYADLAEPVTTGYLATGNAGAFQWNVGDIGARSSAWVAVVVGHDPNPDFHPGRKDTVDAWVGSRNAQQLTDAEAAIWDGLHATTAPPAALPADDRETWQQSVAVMRMAQVRETQYFLRPTIDGTRPRFTGIDGDVDAVTTGTVRAHNGAGALLASLPPGEWTYAWVRDGSYGIVGLVDAGLHAEARAALRYFLEADANRYVDYSELDGVGLPDYALSLTRYHGFGIEESDTSCNGDFNFEWDGFGLFLWAMRHYVEETGDTSLLDEYWPTIRDRVADVIVALVQDDDGLLWPDSSIWEVHWLGREKHFAYTNIVAARGLCDAAALAAEMDEPATSAAYDTAGRALRRAIHGRLRTPSGAIATNTEELAVGTGYWDAAVIEAVSMGLFDPTGPTATATISAIRTNLTAPNGRGIFRNDDQFDAHSLTPWGSFYDSQEWIVLDLRMAIAAMLAGDLTYADFLLDWVADQSRLNYRIVAENYDENTGEYRNNAPMVGFGAGSFITAVRARYDGLVPDPACGFYFEDDPIFGPDGGGDVGPADVGPTDVGGDAGPGDAGPDDVVATDVADDSRDDGGSGADASPDDVAEDAAAEPETDSSSAGDADDTRESDVTRPGRDTSDTTDSEPQVVGGGGGCAGAQTPSPSSLLTVAGVLLVASRRRRRTAGGADA